MAAKPNSNKYAARVGFSLIWLATFISDGVWTAKVGGRRLKTGNRVPTRQATRPATKSRAASAQQSERSSACARRLPLLAAWRRLWGQIGSHPPRNSVHKKSQPLARLAFELSEAGPHKAGLVVVDDQLTSGAAIGGVEFVGVDA